MCIPLAGGVSRYSSCRRESNLVQRHRPFHIKGEGLISFAKLLIALKKAYGILTKAMKLRKALKQASSPTVPPSTPTILVPTEVQVEEILRRIRNCDLDHDVLKRELQEKGIREGECPDCDVPLVGPGSIVNIEAEKPKDIHYDFSKTDVGQGNGCQSFSALQLDVIQQNDGLWLAYCRNWGVYAVAESDISAVVGLWKWLKSQHQQFVLPEHYKQNG